MHESPGARRGQRHWIPFKMELQEVVSHPTWVLGTQLLSSVRAIDVLNYKPSLQFQKRHMSLKSKQRQVAHCFSQTPKSTFLKLIEV